MVAEGLTPHFIAFALRLLQHAVNKNLYQLGIADGMRHPCLTSCGPISNEGVVRVENLIRVKETIGSVKGQMECPKDMWIVLRSQTGVLGMTPRKLLQWGFAIAAVFWLFVASLHVSQEVYTQKFPLLEHLLDTNHALIVSALIVGAAAVGATIVVFLFGATRGGQIELNVLGMKTSGPSGPVFLWVVAFFAIVASIVALNS